MNVLNKIHYFFVFTLLFLSACEKEYIILPPLMEAVIAERLDIVKDLLSKPTTDINERGHGGITALMLASGFHLHASDRQLNTPASSLETRYLILKELLNHNADPNLGFFTTKKRAIIFAIYHGRTESVRALIHAGAEVNFIPSDTFTPLGLATYHCYLDIVKLLLENGADMGLVSQSGQNVKFIALEQCPEALSLFNKYDK